MAKLTAYATIDGLKSALRSLPREATGRLRDASVGIAGKVASNAASRARAQGGAAALVAPSIKATRDRVPVVKMGGSARIGDRKGTNQTVGNLIWGAEYGGGSRPRTRQFPPWRGAGSGAGYFLWPAVREDNAYIKEQYSMALLDALEAI